MNTQAPHIDDSGRKKLEATRHGTGTSECTNILNIDQYNEMHQRLNVTLSYLVLLKSTDETKEDIENLNKALTLKQGATKSDYATAFAVFIKYKERNLF